MNQNAYVLKITTIIMQDRRKNSLNWMKCDKMKPNVA